MEASYCSEKGGRGGRGGKGGRGERNSRFGWLREGGGGRLNLVLRLSWSFLSCILVTNNRRSPNVISPDWWNLLRASFPLKVTLTPVSNTTKEETSPYEEKRVQRSSMLACPDTNSRVTVSLPLASPDWRNGNIFLSS